MYGRSGLERFKKAEAAEPFKVTSSSASAHPAAQPQGAPGVSSSARGPGPPAAPTARPPISAAAAPAHAPAAPAPAAPLQATATGDGASSWQPPEWAVQPRQGLNVLEVMKDGAVVDRIPLDRKRAVFGRQAASCDIVLDHPSVSRQHAAIVHHKNGSVFVVDLGSVHGTVVAGERLKKDLPVELEMGQTVRFAASSRTYVLRKNRPPPANIVRHAPLSGEALPLPPDLGNPEEVLAYNTALNRLGIDAAVAAGEVADGDINAKGSRAERSEQSTAKARRDCHVSFRDEVGGRLEDLVGYSDGAGCLDSLEPGPVGATEGSALTGKFDSLVQTLLIPKGGAEASPKRTPGKQGSQPSSQGMTSELKRYLESIKSGGGLYGGLPAEGSSGEGESGWSVPLLRPRAQRLAQEGQAHTTSAEKGSRELHGGWPDTAAGGPRKRQKQEDGWTAGDANIGDMFVESNVVR